MDASIKDDGAVFVDGHLIGHLKGLKFTRDANASDLEAKTLEGAAAKAVTPEVDRRLTSLSSGQQAIFTLSDQGEILWGGQSVGKIAKSGTVFTPDVELIGGELGNPTLRQLAEDRMREFLRAEVATHLAPLKALKDLQDRPEILPGSKGFAYVLLENHGSLERRHHAKLIRDVGKDERRDLRSVGVTFGQYNIYMSDLIKPKPARLLSLLLAYGAGGDGKPFIPFAGVTSIANEGDLSTDHYSDGAIALAGYKAVGPRIVRFDILNRLASQIRDAQAQFNRIALERPKRPTFQIMAEMLAILGATYEETQGVLKALGFQSFTADAALENPAVEDTQIQDPQTGTSKEEKPSDPDNKIPGENADTKTEDETPSGGKDDAKAENKSEAESSDASETPPTPKRKSREPSPLNVYQPRETLEDGTSRDIPNLEYWTLPNRQSRGTRPHKGGRRQDNRSKKGKGKPRSGGKTFSAGPSKGSKKSIENSPFAALAALKDDNDKSDKS